MSKKSQIIRAEEDEMPGLLCQRESHPPPSSCLTEREGKGEQADKAWKNLKVERRRGREKVRRGHSARGFSLQVYMLEFCQSITVQSTTTILPTYEAQVIFPFPSFLQSCFSAVKGIEKAHMRKSKERSEAHYRYYIREYR